MLGGFAAAVALDFYRVFIAEALPGAFYAMSVNIPAGHGKNRQKSLFSQRSSDTFGGI